MPANGASSDMSAVPMRLNITASAGCRGQCAYCPQDRYQRAMSAAPRMLTAAEFSSLLPRLRGTSFEEISFGGFSEPFDNSEIVELVTLARELTDSVSIYTIGEDATPELLGRMSHLSLNVFDVSCHGFDADVYRRTRPFVDPRNVERNVRWLLDHRANIRELRISMTGPFGGAAAEEMRQLCRSKGAKLVTRELHSRAGLIKLGSRSERKSGPFRCGKFGFNKPVLVPGGAVALCCQDFGLSSILGNLHATEFDALMDSPVRQHVLDVAAGRTVDPSLSCYACVFCLPTGASEA